MRSADQLGKSRLGISSVSGLPIVQAVAQAALHLHPVALDLHAPAAAVAELAAREVGVDVVGREREPGRKPLDHREERRAVGLPGCAVRQGHGARV